MMKQLLYLTLACWFPLGALAQVAISTNGADPDADAMLDVQSAEKGLLIPRMNQAQMEAIGGGSPTTGMMVFNTTSNEFSFYDGSSWVPLGQAGDADMLRFEAVLGPLSNNGRFYEDARNAIHNFTVTPVAAGSPQWQSFTAETYGLLKAFELRHVGTDQINSGTVRIYEGTGTNGTLLFEESISGVASSESSLGDDTSIYTFTSSVEVIEGQVYTLWFEGNDTFDLLSHTINKYFGGFWGQDSDTDLVFATFVIPETEFARMDLDSGTVYLGYGQIAVDAEGNVGIGTDAPESLLHISSAIQSNNTGLKITQGTANSLFYHNENNDLVIRKQSENNQLVLDSGGNVGIGTDEPIEKLHVNGNLHVDGSITGDVLLNSGWYGTNGNNYTVSGGSTGWGNVGNIASVNGLKNGDVILVMVSFLFELDGGSGTDTTAFRIRAEGPSGSDYSMDTGTITDLNRDDTQLFSFQRVMTLSQGAGQYSFRLQINQNLTDDTVNISQLQIVAMKLQ